ncbi:MAG: hypothetical protein JKY56_06475 [Kofleriaceae bacterium]|nr:hypothetical protein [Kofleriaceae bacterium]
MSRPLNIRAATTLSVGVAVVMIAQQVAGKAVRDAFFLSVYQAEVLARVMTVSSLLSVLAVLSVTRLYKRFSPARLVPLLFILSASLFAAELVLVSAGAEKLSALLLYVHTASFGAVAISGFWAVMNERYDPHTAKQVIGRVAGGATLGGLLGGVAAWQGAALLSIDIMLAILFCVNLLCAAAIWWLVRGTHVTVARTKESEVAAWRIFEETPYLRQVALLVILIAFGTAGIDYVFKASAASTYSSSEELVSFFAKFYLGIGIAAFVLQATFAKWFVEKAGVAAAVGTLPLTLIVVAPLALIEPSILVFALYRGSASTVESSSYRSGYELLYTPLAPQTKRPAKALIDVGADKFGAALGSAFAVFLVGLAPNATSFVLVGTAMICGTFAYVIRKRLARGYINALADGLSSGSIGVDDLSGLDPTSRNDALATSAVDRENVLVRLGQRARKQEPAAAASCDDHGIPSAEAAERFLRGIRAFETPTPEELRSALRLVNPVPKAWISAMIPLVCNAEVGAIVRTVLRRSAAAHSGALMDALRDPLLPVETRVEVAGILGHARTRRCAFELLAALEINSLALRMAIVHSLVEVSISLAEPLPKELVFAAIKTELERLHKRHSIMELQDFTANDPETAHAAQHLACCLLLLSTTPKATAVANAVVAIGEDSAQQRGTGREYIDNVIPESFRALLAPLIGNRDVAMAAAGFYSLEQRPSIVQKPTLEDLRGRLGNAISTVDVR